MSSHPGPASPRRWRHVAAALADRGRLGLYARILTGAYDGRDVAAHDLSARERKHLRALIGAGLVTEQAGSVTPRETVFADLLAEEGKPVPADTTVSRFLVNGRVQTYPRRRRDHRELLEHLAGKSLAADETLTEKSLNERLLKFTDDPATLRRHLVDEQIVLREAAGTHYRLNPVD